MRSKQQTTAMGRAGAGARVLVAQIGARRHYLVPRSFEKSGLLEQLVTDACANIMPWRWFDSPLAARLAPKSMRRFIGRRADGITASKIRGLPILALSAAWDRSSHEAATSRWARRNAEFGRRVAEAGFGNANTVYAFNAAALEIFQAARSQGLKTVLDQTAAPWRWNRNMLIEEQQRWPQWEDQPAEIDHSGVLQEREEQEWQLADAIVCGSNFAAGALGDIGGPKEKCSVVPYPIDLSGASGQSAPKLCRDGRKLRVLFVGTLQLRKGVQYLAEALRQLSSKSFEARFVGPNLLSNQVTRELARNFELTGAAPRSELAAHYHWADVLVLPTLSEGSANVCGEAMAAGLPVITTPNAGSTVMHETQGLIVPAGNSPALAAAIERLASDEDLRRQLGRAALVCASERSFEAYAAALADIVAGAKVDRVNQRGAICLS